MIISVRQFDYDTLKSKLTPEDKIIVVSCNNCAKKCKGLGGRPGLAALADKLDADGFNVLHRELIGIACSVDLNAKRTKKTSLRHFSSKLPSSSPCPVRKARLPPRWPIQMPR